MCLAYKICKLKTKTILIEEGLQFFLQQPLDAQLTLAHPVWSWPLELLSDDEGCWFMCIEHMTICKDEIFC